jgi:hypothetical protein
MLESINRRKGMKDKNRCMSIIGVALKPINTTRGNSKMSEFTRKERIRNYVRSVT